VRSNPAATAADLSRILPFFTRTSVKTNFEADLGSALSSDCTLCCSAPKRKIIAVVADNATLFARVVNSAGGFVIWQPMVSPTSFWDFHWYRKDSDRSWSHKRGASPARQDDAAGSAPICNPCNASRSYTSPNVDYSNVVGSWCV
jgi:hypothetical protein